MDQQFYTWSDEKKAIIFTKAEGIFEKSTTSSTSVLNLSETYQNHHPGG